MATLKVLDDTRGGGTCRSCGASIVWFELVSGKRHPFEADPVYLRTTHDEAHRLIGEIDAAESHFAHCPDANEWRRR
jgi:hypothetical protein